MRIINWLKGIKNRVLWEKNNLKKHWLGVNVLIAIISVSSTIIFYEAKPYYPVIKSYISQQKEGYEYANQYLNRAKQVKDVSVSAGTISSPISTESLEEQDLSDTTSPVSQIADEIWMLESTRGKNNYSKCEAIGKVNGIGYGIWGGNWQCFESHEEEMKTLEKWISEKRDKGMTDKELMCLYSGSNYRICK